MWKFVQTTQFKKDYKRYANNKKKLLALQDVLSHLHETGNVPEEYKPHPLTGNYKGALESYIPASIHNEVTLAGTGTSMSR